MGMAGLRTGYSGGYGYDGGGGRRISPPTRARSNVIDRGFGGAGAGGAAGSAAGVPQLPYQPEAPRASGMVNTLSGAGSDLLDPYSDYTKRLKDELTKGIGQAGEAQERGAMLRAVRGDMGSGASPELLEAQKSISDSTMGAIGEGGAGVTMAAPQMGIDALSRAMSGEIGLQGQRLSGYMNQQQLQQAAEQDRVRNEMEQQRLNQEALMRELALLY